MKRTEMREHIFRMVFSYEFNSDQEMPQQMQLYFEQLDQEPKEDSINGLPALHHCADGVQKRRNTISVLHHLIGI